MKRLVVGLLGQPNVGKSTLFNAITRGHVIVTNWPGTTVERHEATITYGNYEIVVVDLPGVYGLTHFTLEEKISRDFILKNKPDLIVVLVDSLALERTMYLAIEILELTSKVVVAITKVDEAHSWGIHINYELLKRALGVPVVPVSAIKGLGLSELLKEIIHQVEAENKPVIIDYGELGTFIDAVVSTLQRADVKMDYPLRWIAVKYLEGDPEITNQLKALNKDLYEELEVIKAEAIRRLGQDLAVIMSRKRFEFTESTIKHAIVKAQIRPHYGEKLIRVFYNPYLAPVISFTLLMLIFSIIFIINTGYPLTVLFESLGLRSVSEWLKEHSLSSIIEHTLKNISSYIYSLLGYSVFSRFLVEAVLGGMSILMLFALLVLVVLIVIGMLEDTGLMPRMAVGLHVVAQKVGLSGHALFPITLSFGCNVPGILVTKAVPNPIERLRLIMLLSFIPCQARLIVLLAVASILGGFWGAILIPLAYITSLVLLLSINYILYKLAEIRGKVAVPEILLELPPIHKPLLKVVWWFTWFYLRHFLIKAGTVIMMANIITWFLTNVGPSLQIVENASESLAAILSRNINPILRPLGIISENAWMIAYALLVGFIAKELFLTTLIAVTGTTTLNEAFSILQLAPSSTIALTIFVSLYIPCLATLATIYSETKSAKLTLIAVLLVITTAYLTSILIYRVLNLFV